MHFAQDLFCGDSQRAASYAWLAAHYPTVYGRATYTASGGRSAAGGSGDDDGGDGGGGSQWVLKVVPWVGDNGTIDVAALATGADLTCSDGGTDFEWATDTLFGRADGHNSAVCAMPFVPDECIVSPGDCSQAYPPVQVAPISLVGKPDPRMWGRVQHEGDCTAAVGGPLPTVRVTSGYADGAVGNILPSPSYASALQSAYPLIVEAGSFADGDMRSNLAALLNANIPYGTNSTINITQVSVSKRGFCYCCIDCR